MAMGGGMGSGARGRGKLLLNRHLYIYINNFSVHRTVKGMGREWRGPGGGRGSRTLNPALWGQHGHTLTSDLPLPWQQGLGVSA